MEFLPHAGDDAQHRAEDLEGGLVSGRLVALRALLVATTLLRTGTVAAGAAIGFYLGDHNYTVYAGFILAAQALAEAIAAPILARYADRVGRRKFLVGGPLIGGIGALLLVAATKPEQFALARVLEGIGAGAFIPTALGLVAAASAHDPRVRAKASSAFEGANLLGYAFGFALAGFVYHAWGRNGYFVLAALYGASTLVCLIFVPRVPALPVSPLSVVFRAITGRGPIRTFLPAWMAAFALIGAYGGNATALLKKATGLRNPDQLLVHTFDERLIGGILTLWIVLLVIGIALWLPILTRIGAAQTMRRAVPGAWIMSLGIFALNHTSLDAWVIFLPIMSMGILLLSGFGPAAVTYLAECSETFIADRSALMSFYTVTLALGGAFGAVAGALAGKLLQVDGLVILGILMSGFTFVALRTVVQYERRMSAEIDSQPGSSPSVRSTD
jgi:MFS family permease